MTDLTREGLVELADDLLDVARRVDNARRCDSAAYLMGNEHYYIAEAAKVIRARAMEAGRG